MVDPLWVENVRPLIDALEASGVDPVEWAMDHDFDALSGYIETHGTRELDFACGYLQATGNLTDKTWAEQIADYLAEAEKEKS